MRKKDCRDDLEISAACLKRAHSGRVVGFRIEKIFSSLLTLVTMWVAGHMRKHALN